MPKDLKKMKNNKKITLDDIKSNPNIPKETLKNADEDTIDNIQDLYQQYSKKDESELQSDLLKMAKKNKAEGKLDNKQIDGFAQKIAPMLDNEKRQKLNDIINMMKNQT